MAVKEYPILGFQPDLPSDTPGVLVTCSAAVPTDRGIGNGITATAVGTAFATAAKGGAVVTQTNGTVRIFAGTSTKLYELTSGTTTTDRSGATYGTTAPWAWCQFGDVTLAGNKVDGLQSINAGATFAAVAGAPKATIFIAPGLPSSQFAMAFDYNDGVNNYHDGIYWSALSDYTNWTTSIASQCGNVRLIDVNGPFTAAIPFRDGVIAFKANAMYLGEYVGGSVMWSWTRLSDSIGCLGPQALTVANDVLYFADGRGLWMFDGSYPRLMPGAIHLWWANSNIPSDVVFTWDSFRHLIWISYTDSLSIRSFIVFNARSGMWMNYGIIDSGTPTFILPSGYALSLTGFMTYGAGYDAANFGFIVGQPYRMQTLKSVRPQWLKGPSDSASTWATCSSTHGKSLRNVSAGTVYNFTFKDIGNFDGIVTDRYHLVTVGVTLGIGSNSWELSKVTMDIDDGGLE